MGHSARAEQPGGQVPNYPTWSDFKQRAPSGQLAAPSQSDLQGAATSKPSEAQNEGLVCWGRESGAASVPQMGIFC